MKKNLISCALIVWGSLFGNNYLRAQWTIIPSPWGEGIIDHMASSDSNIFVSDGISLYVSSDNGIVWENIGKGLHGNDLVGPIVGPILVDGTILFAIAGDSGFVFRSTNKGKSWDSLCVGLPSNAIQNNGGLTGSARNLFICPGFGLPEIEGHVFHSTDSGATWTSGGAGLPSDASITTIAVNGGKVFSGSKGNFYGVFRSVDSGITWSAEGGVPTNSLVFSIASIERILLVGLVTKGNHHGDVYRSSDGGDTWAQSSTGLPMPDTVFQFVTKGPNIFATLDGHGVFFSSDTGQTWKQALGPPDGDPLCRTVAATNQSIFVGTYMAGLWHRPFSDFAAVQKTPTLSSEIELSPNPTSGHITIRGAAESVLHVSVANVLGSEVASSGDREPGSGEISLDLSKLPSGTYFVRITTPEGMVMRKVVKK
jgi:photosystem II stability/assembly factor-like uncharacterized protein